MFFYMSVFHHCSDTVFIKNVSNNRPFCRFSRSFVSNIGYFTAIFHIFLEYKAIIVPEIRGSGDTLALKGYSLS